MEEAVEANVWLQGDFRSTNGERKQRDEQVKANFDSSLSDRRKHDPLQKKARPVKRGGLIYKV
jgi:hypothetical protein